MNTSELFKALNNELADNKIKHVQVIMTKYQDRLAARFNFLDNDYYKTKTKEIAGKYSMTLVKQGKTTATYIF